MTQITIDTEPEFEEYKEYAEYEEYEEYENPDLQANLTTNERMQITTGLNAKIVYPGDHCQ